MSRVLLFLVFQYTASTLLGQNSGSIDYSFDVGSGFQGNPQSQVNVIVKQPDGKYIVGGKFTSYDGNPTSHIVRLNEDGSIDSTFVIGSGFDDDVKAIALQANGKILVGGDFFNYNDISSGRITRLNSDGSQDSTFDSGVGFACTENFVLTGVLDIEVTEDNKILVVGDFCQYNNLDYAGIIRLNTDGSVDLGFNPGIGFNVQIGLRVTSVELTSDGKIVCAGSFTQYDSYARNHIIRLESNGQVDETFNIGSGFTYSGPFPIATDVNKMDILPSEKIAASGAFNQYFGVSCQQRILIDSSGSPCPDFTPIGFDGRYIGYQQNNQMFCFQYTTDSILRINQDGSIDNSFMGLEFTGGSPNTILAQEDGKILVGGSFTQYGGTFSRNLVRLHAGLVTSTDNESRELNVFPNPVMNRLRLSARTDCELTIRDVKGRVKLSFTLQADKQNILDVSSLTSGLYTIVTISDKTITSHRFIKL